MRIILQYILVMISALITVSVLLQNQSSGLGAAFGGESNFYRTKRGTEKFLFYGTMILVAAFVACIIVLLVIK